MLKTTLRNKIAIILENAIKKLAKEKNISIDNISLRIDYPPNIEMGHYSSAASMELAKNFKTAPRIIAEKIVNIIKSSDSEQAKIKKTSLFDNIKVEGPGFINFFISAHALTEFFTEKFIIKEWLDNIFLPIKNEKYLLEFVSANPTGPLNIVSARAASVGDSIYRVLKRTGFEIDTEYYVNDFGNQVRLLGFSFAYRYLQKKGFTIDLPENHYQGDYIIDILEDILTNKEIDEKLLDVEIDESKDSESQLQDFIEALGEAFSKIAVQALLKTHKKDLQDFNVHFTNFFSEATLHDKKENKVEKALESLKSKNTIYEQDEALFFKSTDFTDDKDRVVKRADGRPTYLLADIAYHQSKINRGYNKIIDIWGPDHHGYIARMKGALSALGFGNDKQKNELFDVLIVQQVNLMENGKPVVMSKRLGKFQTMRDLIKKIPVDVSRYFFVSRSQSTHLDFDLELALEQSNQNPVYYIQYAHARIHSIFKGVNEEYDKTMNFEVNLADVLFHSERDKLFFHLLKFPEILEEISKNLEVHRLTLYLHQTASIFTEVYHNKNNKIKEITDKDEFKFLLFLIKQTAEIIKEGLSLLGISAPNRM